MNLEDRAVKFAEGKLEPVIDGFLFRNVVSVMSGFADEAVKARDAEIADELLDAYNSKDIQQELRTIMSRLRNGETNER